MDCGDEVSPVVVREVGRLREEGETNGRLPSRLLSWDGGRVREARQRLDDEVGRRGHCDHAVAAHCLFAVAISALRVAEEVDNIMMEGWLWGGGKEDFYYLLLK